MENNAAAPEMVSEANVSANSAYSVKFVNNSMQQGSACIYQTSRDQSWNVLSIAWMCQFARPQSQANFQWNTNYSFVWGQTGRLQPGVVFNTNQTVNAEIPDRNETTLKKTGGGYEFSYPIRGNQQGSMTVKTDSGISLGSDVAVGIGMSNEPIFATQAQPNMNYSFNPDTAYWIVFGDYGKGQILDVQSLDNAAKIDFQGAGSMRAVLNADNTWTIERA